MDTLLYPLKFEPIVKEKIWGGNKLSSLLNKNNDKKNLGESWEISGVEGDISIVTNGFLKGNALDELIEIYMGDLVGDPVYEKFNKEFPLLFKFIDANQDLSVQVHPDDKLSKERHNAFGKTEMWYVLDAEPDSQLVSGFKKPTNKKEYLSALESGNLTSILKSHTVTEGDVFFIPAGDVHAIGSGVLLAEIQQTSDVTYRIYDYNRKDDSGNTRELHTELALDAIDFNDVNDKVNYKSNLLNEAVNLATCQYFITNRLKLTEVFERDVYYLNSFVVYMCVKGSAKIVYNEDQEESVGLGETILIPASLQNIQIYPDKEVELLEVYVKQS